MAIDTINFPTLIKTTTMQLGLIDTNTIEGRLLIAAIITIASQRIGPNTEIPAVYADVLDELMQQSAEIYKDAPSLCTVPAGTPNFRELLRQAINKHSMETGSHTPDYVLADYLSTCLALFDSATRARDRWYDDRKDEPGAKIDLPGL